MSLFLKLSISQEQIIYVETKDQLLDFLSGVLTEEVLGFDSEFRSTENGTNIVSIMQFATKSCVYIIDVLRLLTTVDGDEFFCFLETIFGHQRQGILLGYSLKSDFRALARTSSRSIDLESCSAKVLDLESFSRGIESFLELPYPSSGAGLSCLTEKCLGRKLDKSLQLSSWGRRPLDTAQKEYAALDAFVLIQIYDVLRSLSTEQGCQKKFIDLENYLMTNKNKLPKVRKQRQPEGAQKTRQIKLPPQPLNRDPVTPKDLRLSCDTMLQGLCRKLRLHGVNTFSPKSDESFNVCGVIAAKESRMILTRGSAHSASLRKFVPSGHCLEILSDKVDQQLKEVWNYFNVVETEKYLFSRCVECNCENYIETSGEILLKVSTRLSHHRTDVSAQSLSDSRGNHQLSFNDIDIESGKIISTGVKLKTQELPVDVFRQHSKFFVCADCGKIYYEGSHWNRYLSKMKNDSVIEKN